MAEYERHKSEQTLLHEVVRKQLESLLAQAREQGAPVARFVERELRAYLDCGVLARGVHPMTDGGANGIGTGVSSRVFSRSDK